MDKSIKTADWLAQRLRVCDQHLDDEESYIDEKLKGLFNKHKIEKTDGTPVDPLADCFVLRLDHDVFAREAAKCYAEKIRYINPKLANDLLYIVNYHEERAREA